LSLPFACSVVLSVLCLLPAAAAAAPVNDNFADAPAIAGLPATVFGASYLATEEPGEPDHAGGYFVSSVWWTWTAPSSGPVLITTCRSDPETALAVYTGDSLGGLTEIASNHASGRRCTSTVTFHAIAGRMYRIAVAGNATLVRLHLRALPESDDFNGARVRAVLVDGPASGTIVDVAGNGRTRDTRRNKVLGVKGRISPPVLPGTPGRRDVCLDPHYEGRLLGRKDPNPQGCGWGRVVPYGRLTDVGRDGVAATTDRRLALRTRSLDYARRAVHRARVRLNAVVDWMIGYGQETYLEVEEAVFGLEEAEALFRRAARAETRAQRSRLVKRGRRWIRDSLETY
jgi:hypothetical protein